MAQTLESRLEKLEVLYAEQDHTVQALNDVVSNQEREITQLKQSLKQLEQQISAIKSDLGGDIDPANETPPHY